jgi:hypothetical protein
LSELDRLAIIGRAMRIGALVLVLAVVVGGSAWLGMRPLPAQPVATTMASQARVPLPLAVVPATRGDIGVAGVAGGAPIPIRHPGVPDVYVVPGVGSFVYLTEDGPCYCGPVAYPSGTIFVFPSPSGRITPCRCADMRNAPPVYPVVHVMSPPAPCRHMDTRLPAPTT